MHNRGLALIWIALVLLSARAQATEYTVRQKDRKFTPVTVTVRSGDVVVIKNDDDVVHNIFSTSEGSKFNRTQEPGTETRLIVEKPGTIVVRCAIHPKMKLTVQIER